MPNNDWMPTTLGGLQTMFANVDGKIASYAVPLGLTGPEVAEIQGLCQEFLVINEFVTESQAYAHGLTDWRTLALYGNPKGALLPAAPSTPAPPAPATYVIGLIAVFRDWRARLVSSSGYSLPIGEDLMIVKVDSESLNPAEVTPTAQASAAQTGYLIGLLVSNRADSDSWQVETRQKGQDWKSAGTFTGKAGEITITPLSPGDPEQVEIRIRLRRKNANYGNLSAIYTVTVNP